MKLVYFIPIAYFLMFFCLKASGQDQSGIDYYQEGKNYIEQGDTEHALEIWLEAYRRFHADGEHDPRIGFEFIRYATELQLENLYAIASEIYFWGLESSQAEPYKEYLKEEIEFTRVIVEPEIYSHWESLVAGSDALIFDELRNFWQRKKIIPSNPLNERLLEHWQRIHYARRHFTKNNNTVYGTDDRGLIYVRLGEPNVEKRRMLNIDSFELRNKAYDLMDYGYIHDPRQVQNIALSVMQTFTPREMDFWRYDIDGNEPVIFLFGRSGEGEGYGLRSSVEEFIPSEAFRRVVFGNRSGFRNLRAGNFLQFMLYNQLSTVDEYFGRQLVDYERNWQMAVSQNYFNGNYLTSLNAHSNVKRHMERIRHNAPVELSDFERFVPSFAIQVAQYRFLDEIKGPVTLLVTTPDPGELLSGDQAMSDLSGDEYQYFTNRGLTFQDQSSGRMITHGERTYLDTVSHSLQDFYFTDIWENGASVDTLKVFTEVYRTSETDNGRNYIIGLATEDVTIDARYVNPKLFTLSDIVLGSDGNVFRQIREEEIGILLDKEISKNENLQVYIEAYNFNVKPEGTVYQIQYTLEPETRRRQSQRSPVSLIWQSTATEARDYQYFEVELDNVNPGDYTLNLEITETHSSRSAKASANLTITE